MNKILGRLEPVELRSQWPDEAANFTPWLAQPENLEQLGDALGLGLELEATEVVVGPYKADVVATLAGEPGGKVVIENQLDKTDHDHLGKALTYAAGLDAKTVIWIAQEFTEEHRQAIDRLNSLATTSLRLFAVEIQLLRIGDSPAAPLFRIVAQPNDYARIGRDVSVEGYGNAEKFYLEFWTAFRDYLKTKKSPLHISKPSPHAWLSIPVGRTGFGVSPNVSLQKGYIDCELYISGPTAKRAFDQSEAQKKEIEAQLGAVDWQRLPQRRDCRIATYQENIDLSQRASWPNYFDWLQRQCEAFVRVFPSRIKALDLTVATGENGEESEVAGERGRLES